MKQVKQRNIQEVPMVWKLKGLYEAEALEGYLSQLQLCSCFFGFLLRDNIVVSIL